MEVKASGAEPRFKVEVRSGAAGIWLATPQGVPYSPLLYTGATGQFEDFAHPYLWTSESVKSGRFRILEVETGPDGVPTRLVVDFELTHPDGWVETGRFSARVRPSDP
jgi:hypothetical protein